MLPRGFLGTTLADESRFDDAVDDVEVLSMVYSEAAEAEMSEKLDRLLLPEAVESGLITQETQNKLRAFRSWSMMGERGIDSLAISSREVSFDYLEETLLSGPLEKRGLSKGELYDSIPLGYYLRDLVRYGNKETVTYLRAELKRLQRQNTLRRRPVEELLGPIDEDSVQGFLAVVKTMPVSTWHEHHIKEAAEAYARRDFDKLNYHLEWLDTHSDPSRTADQFGWRSQLQYMADNPELLDTIFRAGADLKDYDYLTGYAFQSKLAKIRKNVSRRRSDKAALAADRNTKSDSSHGIDPNNRLIDRAGVHSGQYQDLDMITLVLKDIELAELEIARAGDEDEAVLEGVLRERLAELKTELTQVTKPKDIEITFTDEVLQGLGDGGILSYIPGGADNPELQRKIRKSVDAISPEFRPKAILIDYWKTSDGSAQRDSTSAGWYYGGTGVLAINPRTLNLHEHMVVDEKRGTVRRFGPDDGEDGVEIPLGLANSPGALQRLYDIDTQHGMSRGAAPNLDEVAVHESVHKLDYLLASDEFFRLQMRLERELDVAEVTVQGLEGFDAEFLMPSEVEALNRARASVANLQAQLREMNSQELLERWMKGPDRTVRRASQNWASENRDWLEEYAKVYNGSVAGADQNYLLSIFGYGRTDYIGERYGVWRSQRDSLQPGDPKYDAIRETESMEVLAEVLSSQIMGLRRIPPGRSDADNNLPEEVSRVVEQIIPEELKFILSERGWSEEDIPSLTAMRGRSELRLSESSSDTRLRILGEDRVSMVPGERPDDDFIDRLFGQGSRSSTLASDPSATSEMLSAAERDDRNNRILRELTQAEIDEPKLFRDGKLVDKVWAPFSPPPHLAGPGLREELGQAQSWGEVSRLLKGKRVVVFDTETAGRMDPDEVDEDRIVQLGAVVYVDGMVVDRFSMYVNVDYAQLSDWSQQNLLDANGKPMSREFLDAQPSMPDVLEEFMLFANGETDGSDVVFMAHNAAFDLKRMELERQRHDPDGVPSFDLEEITYFDTMGLGNIVKKSGVEGAPTSAGLKNLQEFFGLEEFSWHTADADSEMTGQILWRLLDYMDENDVSLDGLDSVAGVERYREALEKYEAEIPEFLRQKERLAELKAMVAELRSDPGYVMEMVDSDPVRYEDLDGGEAVPVRAGLYDGLDGGYVPDPVSRDDIARHLGFADADELDAATVDDPVMANNAQILQELASYGFSIDAIDKVSDEDWTARYRASTAGMGRDWRVGRPLDDDRLDDIFSSIITRNQERIEEIEDLGIDVDATMKQELAFRKDFAEKYEALTFEERKQAVISYLRNIFDDPDTTVAVASKHVDDVYNDGFYKNLHFPGISGSGGGGPGGPRSESEAAMMGLHAGVPPELRPAYGYIVTGEQRRAARKRILSQARPIWWRDKGDGSRTVSFSRRVDEDKHNEIVTTLMPEVLDELFPGVQKITDLSNDADIETAMTALNEKILERYGLDYLKENSRRQLTYNELELLGIGGYGGGTMLLDPKVLGRSSVSDADSINTGGSPVPLSQDLTDQQLLEMVFKKQYGPKGSKVDPAILEAAIRDLDSTVLLGGLAAKKNSEEDIGLSHRHPYLETQIFGNFQASEIIQSTTGSLQEDYKRIDSGSNMLDLDLPDLTPESEVAAIKAQRAAERADQSIDAVAADAAATIDDLDTVRTSKSPLPDSVGRETFSGSAITPRSLEEVKDTLYYLIGSQDFEEAERVAAMSREEFEAELTSRVSKYLADSLKDGSLSMRVPGTGLREMLAGDGRFKNQFETGRSQAYFDPSFRRALEEGLGVDETVEGALRPKYGYVEGTIWDEAETRVIIDQYGDVNIRFKDEVADRTTVSFGDTLDDSVFGVRISDLSDGSVDPERLGNAIEEFSMANVWLESDTNLNSDGRSIYAELQIHGILGLEDVDEIVLTTSTKKFETREEADAFFKVVQDAGITLKFGDVEEVEEVITAENIYDYLLKRGIE
jgi:DNA polymerase III epsilon subunit-like protein